MVAERAPTFRGERGVYRPLVVEDAPALFLAHADPVVHHFRSGPAHATLEDSIAYTTATLAVKDRLHRATTHSGGEALGRVSLFILREGGAEVGVIVRADAQGKGLCGDALRLVAAHGFCALGLHRIQADIDPDNAPSRRLFERNGFRCGGVLRGNWKTHTGIRDSVIFVRLAERD